MRSIIYCRVSSLRQVNEGNGLGSQEQRCRQYAKGMGYDVLGVFREEGESGGLFERTAMRQLLVFLEENDSNNQADKIVVIFDDLKRFARDVEIHFKLKKEIYGRNGCIESPNFKFEDTPDGKFVETVMAASAALERDQNKRQVFQKMKARLEMGYWAFMPPIGLKNQKDAIHGKLLTRIEPHASILKKAIEAYRDGILGTQEEVRQYLHEQYKASGLPERLALHTVQQILRNPLYAGYIEYKHWNVPFMKAKHEGIISLQTFNAVQERLEGRAKPWKRKDYHLDFPLRPHVLCDGCDKPMTGSYNTGRNQIRYAHYFCRTKGCPYVWKTIAKKTYEDRFKELLITKKPVDDVFDLSQEVLMEVWDNKQELYSLSKANKNNETENLAKEVDEYVKLAGKAHDEILRNVYEDKIRELVLLKKKLVGGFDEDQYNEKDFGTASDIVFGTLKKPMDMWQSDDYNDKRTILFMYFEDQLRYNYERGFGTATLARPVEIIREIGSSKMSSVEMSSSELECKELLKKRLQA